MIFRLSFPDPFQAINKSPPLAARAGLSVLVSARITLFLIDMSNLLQQSNVYAVVIARRHCHELLAAGQSDPRQRWAQSRVLRKYVAHSLPCHAASTNKYSWCNPARIGVTSMQLRRARTSQGLHVAQTTPSLCPALCPDQFQL